MISPLKIRSTFFGVQIYGNYLIMRSQIRLTSGECLAHGDTEITSIK